MLKFRFISILLGLLCSVGVPLFSSGQPLSTTLKEDYYRDMASRENIDPELRIIWYDSLLNLSCPDEIEIQLKKTALLREAGYLDKAYQLSDRLLKDYRNMPENQLLPALFMKYNTLADRRDYIGAMSGYEKIMNMQKPDSLKYWEIKTGFAIYSIYSALNDNVKAKEWLRKTEAMLSSYPLTAAFREDAEARVHGSRAALLIADNLLDSAYKEVKAVRELARDDMTRVGALPQTAQIYLAKGQIPAARQYLEKALKIDIGGNMRRTAVYMMAQCCIREKKFGEALAVLDSYPRNTVKVNSAGNMRAYYIVRGQAYAGDKNLVLAYNSLDSALVVGDTIIANMTRHQTRNAEKLIEIEKTLTHEKNKVKNLSVWLTVILVGLTVIGGALLILLLTNFKLRKRLSEQYSIVSKARIDSHDSQLARERIVENEDNMNRRQTSLLLRLAHLESALDGLKKKLVSDDLDKQARESMVRQIQEINGKEKMWELFSMQFEMTNRKFLDLLSERHPALTKSEKRICAFMLINLSTKEIAELLGRSPRTVDVTKYNIRKKLGITISTEEYLRQVAEEGRGRMCERKSEIHANMVR